jgi:hypothetical protein
LLHLLWLLATTLPAGPAVSGPDSGRAGSAAADTARAVPRPADASSADWSAAPPMELGPRLPRRFEPAQPVFSLPDSGRQRPRAVEYSDFYYTRLTIHRIASYATVPLFVGEYILGTKLYNSPPGSRTTQEWHRAFALGVAGLFAVNTVTGAWNLWDSRHDPAGRTRRYIHAALMFLADAGFVATGITAPSPRRILFSATPVNLSAHRAIAMASMGTALASYAMMLIWKN